MSESNNYKIGHRRRLKERFLLSSSSIPDYELLELILFNAIPRRDVKPYAKDLLKHFGSLGKVINLDVKKLKEFDSKIPESVIFQFELIRETQNRVLRSNLYDRILLNNMTSLNDYLRSTIGNSNIEHFRIFYLNTKNYLIADELMQSGTVDQTSVYPREILKKAIFHEASAIILAHNHPSGISKPSKSDIIITNKIVEACKTIDVKVHDHIIVTGNKILSFKSENLM